MCSNAARVGASRPSKYSSTADTPVTIHRAATCGPADVNPVPAGPYRRVRPEDLTASEINALGNLADGVGRTVSQLGAALGKRPATLTGILDRLERRGLIELTADGQHAAASIRETLHDLEKRALAGLPADAVAGARAVLRALTEVGR